VLVLFDIDGTLMIKASQAHADALYAALHEVHGIADPKAAHVAPAGRTDGEIARAILLGAGVSAQRIDDRADAVREVTCREYAERCPADLSDRVAPGVPELLAELDDRPGVRLALLTGNFEPVARLKLHRAGIGLWFASGQGGFGSDHEDRAALPAIARRRAGRDGESWPRERTVIIGDTPNDIACARADGVRCLAVASGPFAAEDLGGADAVAADAGELAELLDRAFAA
jgi:phosphoglycolate phosphatase-like HAD superfamily hydrolase